MKIFTFMVIGIYLFLCVVGIKMIGVYNASSITSPDDSLKTLFGIAFLMAFSYFGGYTWNK